jgi:hypothetical protein
MGLLLGFRLLLCIHFQSSLLALVWTTDATIRSEFYVTYTRSSKMRFLCLQPVRWGGQGYRSVNSISYYSLRGASLWSSPTQCIRA